MKAPFHLSLTISVPAPTPAPPTRAACEAAVRLGVILPDLDPPREPLRVRFELHGKDRVLITGVSGSGKSRLLDAAGLALADAGVRVIRPETRFRSSRSVLEAVLGAPVDSPVRAERAVRLLASVGLSEAHVLARRVAELSTGQLERLRLAHTLRRADAAANRAHAAILIDEFGATLDDATLAAVARLLSRHTEARPAVSLILASNRGALLDDALRPTRRIDLDAHSGAATPQRPAHETAQQHGRESAAPPGWIIAEGDRRDLEALARHHYRTRPPATIDRVFLASEPSTRRPIGVVAISRPTLNAAWRRLAWPGRYDTPDLRLNARRLNAEVRCISRVIVAPCFRAMGAARALVAHAIAHAGVPHVEALAALGAARRVFLDAGMTEYPVPVSPHDARLLDLFIQLGLEPWRLALPHEAAARLEADPSKRALLRRELTIWAGSSRATRSAGHAGFAAVFIKACRRLARAPRAFAWSRPT